MSSSKPSSKPLNNPLSRPLYLLGYIPSHNRVYLTDKDHRIYGYALSLSVVEYQTAILRGDTEVAAEILPTLPKDQLNKVARFLEARGTSFFLLPPFSQLTIATPINRPQGASTPNNN